MKTLNAGLYEVSPDHNGDPGSRAETTPVRAAERVLGAWDAARPGDSEGELRVTADGESRTLDISAFSVGRFGAGVGVPEGNVI